MTREHGGDLDRAIAQYGGERRLWLDLSTGINPHAYPLPDFAPSLWTALPDQSLFDAVLDAAQRAYHTTCRGLPLAGAQQAIQLYPALIPPGQKQAAIVSPTYNEHDAQLRRHGWQVTSCRALSDLARADCAVVVNPNNPDGTFFSPDDLCALADTVGTLIIDESFCDPYPQYSVLSRQQARPDNILILRSFGKFYGIAGSRLGFIFGNDALIDIFAQAAGKWSVSGPALALGATALADIKWREAMITKLHHDAAQLDEVMCHAGHTLVGGTTLFRLYETADAAALQDRLATHHIWSRIFSYNQNWIRLGLPPEDGWERVKRALTS